MAPCAVRSVAGLLPRSCYVQTMAGRRSTRGDAVHAWKFYGVLQVPIFYIFLSVFWEQVRGFRQWFDPLHLGGHGVLAVLPSSHPNDFL
jgi:hypothetical protein